MNRHEHARAPSDPNPGVTSTPPDTNCGPRPSDYPPDGQSRCVSFCPRCGYASHGCIDVCVRCDFRRCPTCAE